MKTYFGMGPFLLVSAVSASRVSQQRGSGMGAQYRYTTPDMAARIASAIEDRLRADAGGR
jgi:hypothetical protein